MNTAADGFDVIALSLIVSDLEQSTKFYCEGLGFAPGTTKERGDEVAPVLELPTCKLRMRYLGRPDMRIELVEFSRPAAIGDRGRKESNRLGLQSLSIACSDAVVAAEKLVELGGTYVQSGKAGGGRFDMVMVTDPDGLRIQLLSADVDDLMPMFGR